MPGLWLCVLWLLLIWRRGEEICPGRPFSLPLGAGEDWKKRGLEAAAWDGVLASD